MKLNLAARTQAIVLLALVATSGALAGVVGDRLLSDRGEAGPARTDAQREVGQGVGPGIGPGPWRFEARPAARYGERLAFSLELSAAQRASIDSIVAQEQLRVRELTAEVQPRFRAIAEETRGRIEEVLTPEQRARLRDLRAERMRGMRPEMRELMRERRDGMRNGPRLQGARDSVRDLQMERRREFRDSLVRSRSGRD